MAKISTLAQKRSTSPSAPWEVGAGESLTLGTWWTRRSWGSLRLSMVARHLHVDLETKGRGDLGICPHPWVPFHPGPGWTPIPESQGGLCTGMRTWWLATAASSVPGEALPSSPVVKLPGPPQPSLGPFSSPMKGTDPSRSGVASSARRLPQELLIQVPNPRFLSQNPDLQRTAEREPRHAAAAATVARKPPWPPVPRLSTQKPGSLRRILGETRCSLVGQGIGEA